MKIYFREYAAGLAALSLAACVQVDPDAGKNTVEFQSEDFYVGEADGIATITVVRKGSSSDVATVNYSTSASSATAGADFEMESGVLIWEPEDGLEKTFDVPIYADTELEREEAIILTLGGADGVSLGAINRATLNIVDSECAGQLSDNISSQKVLEQGCHLVTNDIYVRQGGKLMIDPGTTLIFEGGTKLQVDEGGTLVAAGTVDQPIIMTGAQQVPGYWNGIVFFGSDKKENLLSHVNIEYGGAETESAGLAVKNSSNQTSRVSIDNTSISHSLGYGFIFGDNTKIELFSAITSTSNTQAAGKMPLSLIPIIDVAGSSFTGNQHNQIEFSVADIEADQHWPALGVPYTMASGAYHVTAELTIEPGAVLAFGQDSQLIIEDEGVLTAIGTENSPIRFTGLTGAAGSWGGIEFAGSPSNTPSQMDYCEVSYGGGGGAAGNISLTGRTGLSLLNLTNSYVTHSQTYGIWLNETDAYVQQSNNTLFTNATGNIN